MNDAPSSPQLGGEIGRFELREKLQGGSPRVYRAYDVLYGREVRLKLYPPGDASLPLLIESHRAAREVRHPAIVPVFEVGTSGDQCYVAGGAAHGRRLSDEIADGPLAHRRAAVITRELAEGLARAHERGVVHGDIYPSGVVLDPEHGAGWLDFGTNAEASPANAAYAAPERLGVPPGPADTASDQYGLGVLLFEMLVGRVPYAGEWEEIVAATMAADAAPSVRAIDHDIPKDLDAICRKALAPDPADRYATCQDFADDLRRWLEGDTVAARPPKRWLVAGLVGTLALTLGGLGLFGLMAISLYQRSMRSAEAAVEQARRAELAARQRVEAKPAQSNNDVARAEVERRQASESGERKRLDEELSKARVAEAKLVGEKVKLEEQKKAEVDGRERAEQSLYCRYVVESHARWQGRDPKAARALLDAAKPADKRPDNRGWEWHFLDRLYQPPKTFAIKLDESHLAHADDGDRTADRGQACRIAYSPDGANLAIGVDDDRVVVWNRLSSSNAHSLEGHKGAVLGMAYSPDGALFVTGGADRTVKVWNPSSGQLKLSFRGVAGAVTDVAFASGGKAVVGGSDDKSVYVWDLLSEERLHKLDGHEERVTVVAAPSEGDAIASASADGVVKLWDAKSGALKHTIAAHRGAVTVAAFSADGARLATAGVDKSIRLWDAQTAKELRVLTGHARAVYGLSFRPDGRRLASCAADTTVCQWDLDTGEAEFFPSGQSGLGDVCYRPDGKQLATAAFDRTVRLWDANRPVPRSERVFRGAGGSIFSLAKSPNGKVMATAGRDKAVRLFDPQTGETTRTLDDAEGPVRALTFTADGGNLVTAGDDKMARIYDVATGQMLRKVAHPGAILAVAVSDDGKMLALGGADGTTRLREFATGTPLLTLTNNAKPVSSVAFSRDGGRVFMTGTDGRLKLFATRVGNEVELNERLSAPTTPGALLGTSFVYPGCVAVNKSGRRLAFGMGTGAILVYDAGTMLGIRTLEGHDTRIHALAFSPDTRRLASAGADGVVKLWDANTGLEVLRLSAHAGAVTGLAWSNDGKWLYTAGEDRLVKVWDGTPQDGKVRADDDDKDDKP